MDNKFIAYCGLDCESCEARLATINDDNELRKKVAKEWSEMNKADIRPEMINCVGCRMEGIKFAYCESIVSIGSLGGVKTIGGRAFYGCNHLRYVCLPEGLQSIKWEAFNCDSLKRVKIPSTVEEIEDKAFVATDADPVILTSEVINIGERAFLYSETRVYCPNFRRGRILYTIYRQEPPADVVEKWINNGKRK